MSVLKKYFKTINNYNQISTIKNISYFNFRAEMVNKIIHNKIIKPSKTINIKNIQYYDGLELVCKKHYKCKKYRLYVNYVYILKNINNKTFTIIEPVDKIEMTFELKFIDYFKLPYCSTCYSVQGLSKDDKVTIFDCNTPYVSKKFIWTAITRVRELDNITIFEHSEKEVQQLTKSRKDQYYKLKIENYKKQDIDAKRKIDDKEYISLEWMHEHISRETNCCLCNNDYYVVLNENNDVCCNITVDRMDNNISHLKSNCRLLCFDCNCRKK